MKGCEWITKCFQKGDNIDEGEIVSSEVMSQKRSVHVGINYVNRVDARLRGCANDASNLAAYFEKQGYEPLLLIDEEPTSTTARPTKGIRRLGSAYVTRAAILGELQNLAKQSRAGTLSHVVFTFSGHGTYQKDTQGEELDACDEMIVPSDFRCISDDEVSAVLRTFDARTKVFLMTDACHSGTMCDLLFQYDPATFQQASCLPLGKATPVYPAQILHLSGCLDMQTSADAYSVHGTQGPCGALTACFLAAVKKLGPAASVQKMYAEIHALLQKTYFTQRPLVTSTFALTTSSTFDW
jgi:hypothetical protein